MSETQPETYTVFCAVRFTDSVFPVKISSDETVGILKQKIKEQKPSRFAAIDADELKLHHVEIPDDDKLVISMRREMANGPTVLKATMPLTDLFACTPPKHTVHIIVQSPSVPANNGPFRKRQHTESSNSHQHMQTSDIVYDKRWCPRTDTVSQLLDLLHQYRLVNVRAPPGSGKTALMHLLHARIMEETPDAQVYIHDSWPEDKLRSRDYRNHLYEKLPGYPNFRDSPRYFLFDKGETTYWDGSLWLTFKDRIQPQIRQHGLVWAILFSNYGDGVPWRENGPVPLVFGGGKVTLYRFPRHDSRPFGLLMDKGEYNDVLARYRPRFRIADDLREFIYDLTNGYIGCIMAVVEYLRHQRRDWMLEREDYSLEYFMEDIINYNEFYQKVSENRSMRHVLPENPAEYAQAIRTLFIRGPFGTYSKGISSDVASKLEEGRKIGFIDVDEDYKYMFPSPLHQLLWEWRLASEVDYDPPFSNLFDFLEATVAYLPLKLVGSDGPTEARYRKAFYHSVQFVTRGNAQSLPDHVASTRIRVYRVDFIIPIKSWGIRLIRDEKEITDHKYWFHRLVRCQKEQVMEENKLDGIVDLGFCDTRPQEKYPALENMYRVWIDGAQSCYEIYDNMLNVRGKGNILQQNDP